jgi:hypothetical protein
LDLTNAPGTDRLFVAERYGKVYSFPNDPTVARADLFLDVGKVIYGIAFHPRFAENGYVYVTYIIEGKDPLPDGTHLARFQAKTGERPTCDPASEELLLTWRSGGHNGGCLKFGPDGYLYVATGDAGDIADTNLTGQDLGVLPGKILRIDVDRKDAGKNYAIPADNPFVEKEGADEIWHYGVRNPSEMWAKAGSSAATAVMLDDFAAGLADFGLGVARDHCFGEGHGVEVAPDVEGDIAIVDVVAGEREIGGALTAGVAVRPVPYAAIGSTDHDAGQRPRSNPPEHNPGQKLRNLRLDKSNRLDASADHVR